MRRIWIYSIMTIALSCVEPISFEVPPAGDQLVVEGYVQSGDGPHKVLLSKAGSIEESDSIVEYPVTGAEIILYEDRVRAGQFIESEAGNYMIEKGLLSTKIGSKYHIEIKTADGHRYQSLQDQLQDVGTITEMRTEFDKRSALTETGETDASVLKVLVDGKMAQGEEVLTRWRFKVTYQAETFPMWHLTINPPYDPPYDPFPCSGYIVTEGPIFSGGLVIKVGECECCDCWADLFEPYPSLSDEAVINGDSYYNMSVCEIPISPAVFAKKAQISVEQMSLSRTAFDFFSLIRSQKENAQSIFQPVSGELRGNMVAASSADFVTGIFYATSISTSTMMIDSTDVPIAIPDATYLTWPCAEIYENATYKQPDTWD